MGVVVVQLSSGPRPEELSKTFRVSSIRVGALHLGVRRTGRCEGPGFFFCLVLYVFLMLFGFPGPKRKCFTAGRFLPPTPKQLVLPCVIESASFCVVCLQISPN